MLRLGRLAVSSPRLQRRASSSVDALFAKLRTKHESNNIPESILSKVGQKLHLREHHPLQIVKKRIEEYCLAYGEKKGWGAANFAIFDDLSPLVDTKSCFDDLRVKPDHVSRRPSDTYYCTNELVLRTHTSAHQSQFIAQGVPAFLCSGDVYRRDEIDASHYPVFHQMEGVRIFDEHTDKKDIERDLKEILTGLAVHLFGQVEMRWREDYFPFTEPSFELDIFFNDAWIEVLGCGVIHDEVMALAGARNGSSTSRIGQKKGWAFGLGLERLAMVLFAIPDIRLFWTQDERFHSQFRPPSSSSSSSSAAVAQHQKRIKFVPYSKYPLCYKDVSFWLPSTSKQEEQGKPFHSNDVYEIIRSLAGDLVERVELFDQFVNKKTQRTSHAYRVTYRHMDRSLTNEEVDEIQFAVRKELVDKLAVELR